MTIPSFQRRSFSETAVATTLAASINDTDLTITIDDATGWPSGSSGDFYIRIENETIRVDTRTTTQLTVLSDGRGANGTTAASHAEGVAVTLVFTSFDADEANYVVNETVGKITTAGDILVADGANSLDRLALGSSGLPLKSNGTTVVYGTLGSDALAADSVGSSQIATDAVDTAEIKASAVTASELASDAVTTAKILDANVTTAKLASQAVTEAKLHTSVAGDGLAGGNGTALSVSVDDSTVEIATDSVQVKDGGITGAKLNSDVVDDSTLALSSSQLIIKDAGITSAKFNSEAATSWTPSISGTGWSAGNATRTGIYIKHGRMVWVQGIVTMGNTTSFGSGSLSIGNLPVAMNSSVGANGTVFINDASTSTDFFGTWSVSASGSSGVVYTNGVFSAPGTAFRTAATSSLPMTWASGDSITFSLFYIAAS
jgi:hypothetical protein